MSARFAEFFGRVECGCRKGQDAQIHAVYPTLEEL